MREDKHNESEPPAVHISCDQNYEVHKERLFT